MSSIMTNAASMAALQTMRSINDQMDTTQNRISSGYRVATASDNAAYWSIATTMRSDNAAMSTVSDALGLGSAQVDVAYTAMESVKDTLDEIKTKLVAAQQPDVDKSKIQAEISQLQDDLKTFAESATFSGGNWLSVGEDGAETQKIVASFMRDESGSISLGTIDVDTAKTALFNAGTDETGLLEQGAELDAAQTGGLAAQTEAAGDGAGAAATVDIFTADPATDAIVLDEGNSMRFDLIVNGETTSIEIDRALVDETLGTTDGTINTQANLTSVVSAALTKAGVTNVTAADGATAGVALTHTVDSTEDTIEVANVESSTNGNYFSATEFDITSADEAQLSEYLQGIDSMLSSVTSAAADLGAIKTRVGSQQDFVSKLMDAVDRGVGQLVDADMNEESTRLKALQTQQQLGIQALSIANSNSQNILSLFRG